MKTILIMRGDTDLADRYGLEILRFYEHYRFRYYAKLLKLKKAKPLEVDDHGPTTTTARAISRNRRVCVFREDDEARIPACTDCP